MVSKMGDQPDLVGEHNVEAVCQRLLESELDCDKVDAYETLLLFQTRQDGPDVIAGFCRYLSRLVKLFHLDILSDNHQIATLALKSLGFFLHSSFVSILEEEDSRVLLALCELITTTKIKILCNLGVWCISVQKFDTTFLSLHFKAIINALAYAIDNPLGSSAVTFEAFEALKVLNDRVSNNMRECSHVWVPPLYRRLLNASKNEMDMAEQILEETKNTILPPMPKLMQMVVTDVKETYLLKMKEMASSQSLALVAVRAWGWFVRLLDNQFVENRSLVNEMLIIPQSSFAASSVCVRIASQISWRCFIDVAVKCFDVTPMILIPIERDYQSGSSSVFPSKESLPRQPSLSYLKLLMKPILNIFEVEKDTVVIHATWQTWLYMLHKLGLWVNEPSVFKITAAPIFEFIFTLGPGKVDMFLWNNCTEIFLDYLKCKLLNSSTGRTISDKISTGNSPINTNIFAEVSEGANLSPVRWAPWGSIHIELLLHIVAVLWTSSLKYFDCSEKENLNQSKRMNAALEIWRMVVRGVENDQRDRIKPSDEDVLAVHSLLKVVAQFCSESSWKSHSKETIQLVWMMIEILLEELGPVSLASSFYKVASPLKVDEKSACKEQSRVSIPKGGGRGEMEIKSESQPNLGFIKGVDSVTPVTYLLAIWIEFLFQNQIIDSEEKTSVSRIQKLSAAASVGLNSMANFHGKSFILEWFKCFLDGRYKKAESQRPNNKIARSQAERKSTSLQRQNCLFLFEIWAIFSEELRMFIESTNDVPSIEGNSRDSGYCVVYSFLTFPLKLYLHPSFYKKEENIKIVKFNQKCHEDFSEDVSKDKLQMVKSCWLNLYNCVSRVASLKRSRYFLTRCMFRRFKAILDSLRDDSRFERGNKFHALKLPCEFLELSSTAMVSCLKHVEISSQAMLPSKRERRENMSSSTGHIHNTATVVEDPYNIKEILLAVSRFLALTRVDYLSDVLFPNEVVIRILDALAALVNQIHTRHEALLLLQVVSNPLGQWISIGQVTAKPGSVSRRVPSPLLEQLGRVWDGLLACLQRSHPAISFDSNLLAVHAPSLSRFLLHYDIKIVNRTLAFWEATYGCKTACLKYPSCLIPILQCLKTHVKITLPGWKQKSMIAISPESGEKHDLARGSSCSESDRSEKENLPLANSCPVSRINAPLTLQLSPCTGQLTIPMVQHCHADKKSTEKDSQGVPSDLQTQPVVEMNASMDHHKKLILDEPHRAGVMATLSPMTSRRYSIQELSVDLQEGTEADFVTSDAYGNGSLEVPMSEYHDLSTSSKCTNDLAARNEIQINIKPIDSSTEVVTGLEQDTILSGGIGTKLAGQVQGQLGKQNKVDQAKEDLLQGMQQIAGAKSPLAVDVSKNPAKTPVEQSHDIINAVYRNNPGKKQALNPLLNAITSGSATCDWSHQKRTRSITRQEKEFQDGVPYENSNLHKSHFPKQQLSVQKNIDHLATECTDFVVIPSSQTKKMGPLTDHQKEVRRSQRLNGLGVKTYTLADFSQGDTAGTSEDFQNFQETLEHLDLNVQLGVDELEKCVVDVSTIHEQKLEDDNAKVDSITMFQDIDLIDSIKGRDSGGESMDDMAVQRQPRHRLKRELDSLGLKQRPLLRSSGKLRGGKHWRLRSEAAKALTMAKLTKRGGLNISGTRKRRKIGKPLIVEYPNVNGNSLNQLRNANLPSLSCDDLGDPKVRTVNVPSEIPNMPDKAIKLYSPFKVQTLNRGFWVSSFVPSNGKNRCRITPGRIIHNINSAAKLDSEDPESAKNHNKRKSNAPKKIFHHRETSGIEELQSEGACLATPIKKRVVGKRRRLTGSPCSLTEKAILRALTPLKKLKTGRQGGRTYARRLSILTKKPEDSTPDKVACNNMEDLISDKAPDSLQKITCSSQLQVQELITDGSKLKASCRDDDTEIEACRISNQCHSQSAAEQNGYNFLSPSTEIVLQGILSDEINVCQRVQRTSKFNNDELNHSMIPGEGKSHADGSEVCKLLENSQLKARDVLSVLAFSTMWDGLELSDLLQVEALLSIIGLKVAVCKARKVAARTNAS